jgi:hypothetical protein
MTPTPYNAKRRGSNGPSGSAGAREQVTIPNAHALGETAKALRCDLGDDADHWVAKSHIAPQSEVKKRGDRGRLVVSRWLAEKAHIIQYARPASPWANLPHTRHRLQELDATLATDDPARAVVKKICDAIRADLGATRETGRGGGNDGGHANSETR